MSIYKSSIAIRNSDTSRNRINCPCHDAEPNGSENSNKLRIFLIILVVHSFCLFVIKIHCPQALGVYHSIQSTVTVIVFYAFKELLMVK